MNGLVWIATFQLTFPNWRISAFDWTGNSAVDFLSSPFLRVDSRHISAGFNGIGYLICTIPEGNVFGSYYFWYEGSSFSDFGLLPK